MTSKCIVTQVHVPDFDPQGGLTAPQKRKLVEFGLRHLRAFNPDAYIILTGHGHRPDQRFLALCNFVHWNDRQEPLDSVGYVVGMPAQFKYVSIGLEHARTQGFARVLKTRGDCIIGHTDICTFCNLILDGEHKQLLITQQTGLDRLGDCFMYGDTELLCKIWHKDNPIFNSDGLQNTAHHFRRALQSTEKWRPLVKRVCAFRDVDNLKFMCLRWNFVKLQELTEPMCVRLLLPSFDFAKFHWGRTNGAHYFNHLRDMIGAPPYLWSEKRFYDGHTHT